MVLEGQEEWKMPMKPGLTRGGVKMRVKVVRR